MRRASLSAICTPSEIAALNLSPSAAGLAGGGAESVLRAKGAVFTGRPVASRTKPKNRPDFEYLSILSLPPFIDRLRLEDGPA